MALGRQRLADSHRDYARRLLVARDEERRLTASEVHAELVQRAAAIRNTISAWRKDLPSLTADQVIEAEAECQALSDRLRRIAHRIYPAEAQKRGMAVAMTELANELEKDHDFRVEVGYTGPAPGSGDFTQACYRIIEEALMNALRHSGVGKAVVWVRSDAEGVTLEIEDEGRGFDQTTPAGRGEVGLGLRSMRERAELVGGTVTIRSRPGGGTQVIARMPWPRA